MGFFRVRNNLSAQVLEVINVELSEESREEERLL